MIESLEHSVYFGVFLSLGTYAIGLVLKKKLRYSCYLQSLINFGVADGADAAGAGC